MILLSKWAGPEHRSTLKKVFSRIADVNQGGSGLVAWLGLRWYPVILLMYMGGIAALSAENYDNLITILTSKVSTRFSGEVAQDIIAPAVEGILEAHRSELFKTIPGHERQYVPRSEYLFKVLQPRLEDLLFLGRSYEPLFDRFEIFFALIFADLDYDKRGDIWGPPGRFVWKYRNRTHETNPFTSLKAEADRLGDDWPPFRAGFFKRSHARFNKVVAGYEELMKKLNWY